jgi:hypothetical protein
MRAERSPSILRSIHKKISLYPVYGQAEPHHKRPATAVNKNSDKAEMTNKPVK